MIEVWKDIKGYEGLYQASSLGRIKSLDRTEYCGGCVEYRKRKGRIIPFKVGKQNYLRVHLSKEGKRNIFPVSHLIFETFNGPIPKGMQVNHINEDRTDNRPENLNLMTPKENCNWGTRNKRISLHLKKPVTQILPDGTEFFSFFSATDAANGNDTLRKHITACCTGKRKTAGGFKWRYAS